MRAHVELTQVEREALRNLTDEERAAVVEQILERVREDLEWTMALDHARLAAVKTPKVVAAAEKRVPRPAPPVVDKRAPRPAPAAAPAPAWRRYCWPSTPVRTRAR